MFLLGAAALLAAGGRLTDTGPWYAGLTKPRWQPPGWVFAPAWTAILGLAAWAGVLSWMGDGARWPVAAAFGVNAVLHLLWTPLFFKARRPDWALVEIGFLLLSIAGLMAVAAPRSPLAVLLLVPYLGWVGFAAYLNRGIVRLNGPAIRGR